MLVSDLKHRESPINMLPNRVTTAPTDNVAARRGMMKITAASALWLIVWSLSV